MNQESLAGAGTVEIVTVASSSSDADSESSSTDEDSEGIHQNNIIPTKKRCGTRFQSNKSGSRSRFRRIKDTQEYSTSEEDEEDKVSRSRRKKLHKTKSVTLDSSSTSDEGEGEPSSPRRQSSRRKRNSARLDSSSSDASTVDLQNRNRVGIVRSKGQKYLSYLGIKNFRSGSNKDRNGIDDDESVIILDSDSETPNPVSSRLSRSTRKNCSSKNKLSSQNIPSQSTDKKDRTTRRETRSHTSSSIANCKDKTKRERLTNDKRSRPASSSETENSNNNDKCQAEAISDHSLPEKDNPSQVKKYRQFNDNEAEGMGSEQDAASELSESEDGNSSSTSSDSLSEAQNPLNDIEISDTLLNCSGADSVDIEQIPIWGSTYSDRHKHVEILIISGEEFSVELFVEHHQTGRRIPQYPSDIVDKFLALPVTYRRFENNKFVFQINLVIFDHVKEVILSFQKKFQFNGIENVISALTKYNHVDDEKVLVNTGFKCVKLRIDNTPELKQYQRDAILFAYLRQGRCMLADSSGMGKRVEAIHACFLFEDEWPVIIICSTSQQHHWRLQLEHCLPNERRYKFKNLETPEDCKEYMAMTNKTPPECPDFTIIGYTLLRNEANHLKTIKYKVVIIDESHKIKHAWTTTTKCTRQIIKRAKRRFLLTSNPAFGVPDELFCQLHVIDRKAFKDCRKFADRYCGFESRFDKKTGQTVQVASRNWRSAKNLDELKHLLHNTVMTRHFKADDIDAGILLPVKNRLIVKLDFQPDERTKRILGEMFQESRNSLDNLLMDSEGHRKAEVFIWFKKSGKAKLNLICKYLDQLDMSGKKIIIYGRHIFVVDGIQKLLEKKSIGFVRIRGDYGTRCELSDQFNNDVNIRVALLSLSISEVGVNLTKADTIIFAELYWLPDSILRNEDRAWNFFQLGSTTKIRKTLDITYLIASDVNGDRENQIHMDLHLWEMLEGKIHILIKLGLLQDDFTLNIPETTFQAISSNTVDDLKFSDVSSNESDHEYIVDEESESETDSESSPTASSHLSDDGNSTDRDRNSNADAEKSPSNVHNSEQEETGDTDVEEVEVTDNRNGNSNETSVSETEKQQPRRITRSQSVLSKPDDSESESTSDTDVTSNAEDESTEKENTDGESKPKRRKVVRSGNEIVRFGSIDDTTSDSDSTSDIVNKNKKVLESSDSKNDDDDESSENSVRDDSESSSDNSVKYDREVKKLKKSFIS